MGRAPCCDKASVKRGPWSLEEDDILRNYLQTHGAAGGNWIALPRKAGLNRCGKSCRLRWLNYLRPGIKHGGFTDEEDTIICNLYNSIGSRWSVIASQLPGRTDNDIKNYWNTKLKKKLLVGKIPLKNNNELPTTNTSAVEVEVYGNGNSGFSNANSSTSYVAEMNYHQGKGMEAPGGITFPGQTDVSDYGTNANNSYSISSASHYHQEMGMDAPGGITFPGQMDVSDYSTSANNSHSMSSASHYHQLQGMGMDAPGGITFPGQMDVSDYSTSANNSHSMSSASHYHQLQGMGMDAPGGITFPGQMDVSDYSTSANNSHSMSSASQEVSSLTNNSASFAQMENFSATTWSGINGSADKNEGSLLDFDFVPSPDHDFLISTGAFGFQGSSSDQANPCSGEHSSFTDIN